MFKNKILYLDGAMGSEIIKRGYNGASELLNLTNPQVISDIHLNYVNAGSNVIYTNTFGANPFKYNDDVLTEIILNGISIAKNCTEKEHFVALDIGSMGKLIGVGGCSFDDIYNAYKKIITIANDLTDFIVIETINDLIEGRIALLAAKENSKLPVVLSLSFEENGKTVFGNPISSFAVICESLGADAVGINCSLSAEKMLPLFKELTTYTNLPIFLKPNAGQPDIVNGQTIYKENPSDYAKIMKEAYKLGANAIGGCCGTNPQFIKELVNDTKELKPFVRKKVKTNYICSPYVVKSTDVYSIIGERINPTGKKLMQKALLENDLAYILSLAVSQEEKGADVLDVNVGMNGINEVSSMVKLINELITVTNLPLQIDSSNKNAIESALRIYPGRAIVNSINGKEEVLNELLPIIKKYGALVVGLTLDENGIPETPEIKVEIAKKIIRKCKEYGIKDDCILIDTLTMSEASKQGNALNTLKALKMVKELGVKTVLGVSNISFGMPKRDLINSTFLQMSKDAGLDFAIINPSLLSVKTEEKAKNFLLAKPGSVDEYISFASQVVEEVSTTTEISLDKAIITGQKHLAQNIVKELINNGEKEILKDYIIPALDYVGSKFEKGEMFLPQLISSAEAAKTVIEYIQTSEKIQIESNGKTFILATVKDDVHDIGKNIVKAVVSNYGFEVVDLGKDVGLEEVIRVVKNKPNCVVGLSALMTTTVVNMEKITKELTKMNVKTICGGAVLTREYCESFGGIYAKDANEAVKILKNIFNI